LRRRPNHGPDFLRKMTEMNRDGALAITTYHSLQNEVLTFARFTWRCRQCGHLYRRQRRTIQPTRHHCGICRGALQELGSVGRIKPQPVPPSQRPPLSLGQLSFTY
jgi:predicted SprT family Zn-dependent metalloprotease